MSYPVFYSDTVAKALLTSDLELMEEVKLLFGSDAYQNDQLNRKYIADQLFSNQTKKEKMNALVHPKVREAFDIFSKQQTSKLVFNEAALLFETGSYVTFDAIFLVTSPLEKRIERTMKRDACTRNNVLARIANQMSDEEKLSKRWFTKYSPAICWSAYEIVNSDEKLLIPQIEALLEEILTDEIYY
jgi:dephospho-CoA kinase